eukprot:6206302-Pleurochrysis_carterae.AAC.1
MKKGQKINTSLAFYVMSSSRKKKLGCALRHDTWSHQLHEPSIVRDVIMLRNARGAKGSVMML